MKIKKNSKQLAMRILCFILAGLMVLSVATIILAFLFA